MASQSPAFFDLPLHGFRDEDDSPSRKACPSASGVARLVEGEPGATGSHCLRIKAAGEKERERERD